MPIDKRKGAAVANHTTSGSFKTSDGTLYVSKPFRSKSSKQLRAMITFTPRKSHFDTTNESSGTNEFRGFFSLFWISMFLFTIRTYVRSIETHGHALNFAFATMFSRDAITLAMSDALLVSCTALCVPFAKAISKGWIQYYWTGLILQHVFQTFVLFTAITWTFNREWPWVQSGFLTLHSLVMIMKMHSYMTVNGHLQYASIQSQALLDELRQATLAVGGWDQALTDAQSHRPEIDASAGAIWSDSPTPSGTPNVSEGTSTSYIDAPTALALRRRLTAVSLETNDNFLSLDSTAPVSSTGTNTPSLSPKADGSPLPKNPHPLVDHPDQEISALAKDYSELERELISCGPHYVTWPNNITFKNFTIYQLIPTLVYKLEYPRTDRIRPLYLFEKTVATFGTFALLYTVTESFILPQTPSSDQSFFRSLLDLALPFMIAYLLLFYIIFECICNGFAELSYFADRQFYEDWYGWNSTSWEEFSRKWNKPVHMFLLHHVYGPTLARYELSKTAAMFVTFLLSACVHELVMVVVTHKIRMYLFLLQLIQVPLIAVSRLPAVKHNKLMGNIVFWLGLYAGFPLLCVAYVAY